MTRLTWGNWAGQKRLILVQRYNLLINFDLFFIISDRLKKVTGHLSLIFVNPNSGS